MKRIIGMMLAVCICLGLQMNISHAENWQTVYGENEMYQLQTDTDSIERLGPNVYCAWEKTLLNDQESGARMFYMYTIQPDETGMYCGTKKPLASLIGNRYSEITMDVQSPIYSMSPAEIELIIYLQQKFGDQTIPKIKWAEFYSEGNEKHMMEMSYLTRYGDRYSTWVCRYNDRTKKSAHTRMEYRKDENGKLMVRSLFYVEGTNLKTEPQEWEPAERSRTYPTAEKEFAFIKAYLGEK